MLDYFMEETRNNLDLPGILDSIDTLSPYGDELKAAARPYLPAEERLLEKELENLAGIICLVRSVPREKLEPIKDLFFQLPRVRDELDYLGVKAALTAPMFFNLNKFLYLSRKIREHLDDAVETAGSNPDNTVSRWWRNSALSWPVNPELLQLLKVEKSYSFYIGNYGDAQYKHAEAKVQQLEAGLRQKAAVDEEKILKELDIKGLCFSGKVLTVSKKTRELADRLSRHPRLSLKKESITRYEFTRKELPGEMDLVKELDACKNSLWELESKIMDELSLRTADFLSYLKEVTRKIGQLDWLLSKAFYAEKHGASVPLISRGSEWIKIRDGFHPVVDNELKTTGRSFTPLSIELFPGAAVLTGANMSGKTIALKTVGTLAAMSQMALPVTAGMMKFRPVDFMFFSTARDGEKVGLSGFATEVQALNRAVEHKNTGKRGLVLLDEPARGTNPEEGAAIARAFLNVLARGGSYVMAATHFDGLVKDEGFVHWQVRGLKDLNETLIIKDIYSSFDYCLEKISQGDKVPRDALKVAALMKTDRQVLGLAKEYLQGETGKGDKSC